MNPAKDTPVVPTGFGCRHTLAWMGFWAYVVNIGMRFNLSMTIVAMVKHPRNLENFTLSWPCVGVETNGVAETREGDFEWTESEQGLILGSFFWGFCLTQLPGGIISEKYGGKLVVGLGLLIAGLFTFLIPVAAYMGIEYIIFVRVVQGLAEGVVTPSIQVLLSKWLPPNERSRLATITYAGAGAGSAVTMVASGYIIDNFDWSTVFYGTGCCSLAWFIFWSLLVYDSPDAHPRITKAESTYIMQALGGYTDAETLATPWRKILTCGPVWTIFIAQLTYVWGLTTLQMELPTYMSRVLNFGVELNSWFSATPHLCMLLCGICLPYLADILIERKYATLIRMRKVCNTMALWGAALALVVTAAAGCNWILAVVSLNFAVGMLGVGIAGATVNSIDIAPNHAGVIMGLICCVANLCSFGAPYLVGLLASSDPTWSKIFFISAGIMFAGNTVFIIFASADEMSWNRPITDERKASVVSVQRLEIPELAVEERKPSVISGQMLGVPGLQTRRYSAISETISLRAF